ncbi:hypothetical protein [Microbispora sp. NPDC046933]|uniref:hypothetical protein n=1 Tax=Microbispora sp. NPDC046933 TaxID=3155618 RepID=UPI0033C6180D
MRRRIASWWPGWSTSQVAGTVLPVFAGLDALALTAGLVAGARFTGGKLVGRSGKEAV